MSNRSRRVAGQSSEVAKLREQVSVQANNAELLQEAISDLEAQLREPGWVRMAAAAQIEFSRTGLGQIADACRLVSIKNPLIVRGLALRAAYIWGQGVEISARATGRRDEQDGEQDVNDVVQAFLDDEGNQRSLTGEEAQIRLERTVATDGNVFIALFTKPTTGRVQARTIPFAQVSDVITNPEDAAEPWYYRRKWTEETTNLETGTVKTAIRERLYPAVGYRPKVRPKRAGSVDIAWDAPIVHVKVNDLDGWKFGIGDVYAAVDWAMAYKDFLTDWARLMKSLSRYAWKVTAAGSKAAVMARNRIAQVPAISPSGEVLSAGGTAVATSDMKLESVSKSGATLDSDSGRPLAAMVAAALGVPVTMLLGDPGVTGARATAQTLDRPTELGMQQRQGVWGRAFRRILEYVIQEAARAPKGPLKGTFGRDEEAVETFTLAGDTDSTINIIWSDLDDIEPQVLVEAITKANATGTVPPDLILQLLLSALGVRDIDEILERMVDEDGKFLWPTTPLGGQAAADADRAGQDPAELDGGPMTPDGEDVDPDGGDGGGNETDPPPPASPPGSGRD